VKTTFRTQRNSMARAAWVASLFVLTFWSPTGVAAAARICNGKLVSVEKMICIDQELSALDTRLEGLYWLELAMTRSKAGLRRAQEMWLKGRRSKCRDESCLAVVYRKRISELNELIQQSASSPPALVLAEKEFSEDCPADRNDIFMLKLQSGGDSVSGFIDGSQYCNDKLLGSVSLTGHWVGKVAIVQFDPGWRNDATAAPAEAMVAVSGRRVFWVILTEMKVLSLIPARVEMVRVHKFLSDDEGRSR
jgi:uncharacterized protein